MKKFEPTADEIAGIRESEFTYAFDVGDNKEGDKGIMHHCPFHEERHCNSQYSNRESVIKHMAECPYNPRVVKYNEECRAKYDELFDTFQFAFDANYEEKMAAPTALKEPKFLMGSGYYHKALSNPDSEFYDLIRVTHETEQAYLGNFVFGIGAFHMIYLKDKVRELTEEEVNEFHGQNIAISSNPAHASLNIKENKYDQPRYGN